MSTPPLPATDLVYQVDVLESIRQGHPVRTTELTTSPEQRKADNEYIQTGPPMLQFQGHDIAKTMYHIYIHPTLIARFDQIQSALGKVTTNIIERWFSDEEANFLSRMPIDEHEENVLRWIATSGIVPRYAGREGCSRPDFLFSATSENPYQPIVCEINSRFPYNSWFYVEAATEPFERAGLQKAGLKTGHDSMAFGDAVVNLFDSSHPGHILLGTQWTGFDVHLLPKIFKQRTGQEMRIISPSDLRLTEDTSSPTGYHLSCTAKDSGQPERVWQISMDMVQAEIREFSPEILREIARICTNDLRSVFLLHDKRFLGIVLEELDSLLEAGVVDLVEAQLLKESIAPTYVPGSAGWHAAIHSPNAKEELVLKNARAGIGMGHTFGHKVTQEVWDERLRTVGNGKLVDGKGIVLQKKVDQISFDILNLAGDAFKKLYLIGAWAAVNGQYLGVTSMRVGNDLGCVPPPEGGMAIISITSAS
ncbi:taurine catabolism dioxygenase [Trichoderma arundinaceum]|uniref:Taurine catabolism dioxygenase n=1 Tax=Trichoderma arundinaceum TaxID=490622 RepID=A0A395NCU3_TRIAR|nr:taurine catabolism dioxygenase [Trichoderma arundinaceum]